MIVTGTYSPTAEDIIHSVEVDLVDRQMISEPIHVVQYDKQLPVLEVKLWKNTQPYSVPAGCEVNVRYEKPDGTVVYNNVLGLSSNRQTVYVQISQQMTMAYGKADAVIEIKTSAGKIAATATIVFDIDRNPVQEDAIESSSEFKALESYVSDAASSAAKAKVSETNAKTSETKAKTSETNAKTSETKAKTSETAAKTSETNAKSSENNAKTYAQNAEAASSNATEKADAADAYATEAESWVHGGTGTREGEDADNAQAYYEQAKRIVQNFNGLVPMGTIPFSELSNEENQYPSYMFNISEPFTSDTRFKDGGGIYYGAGNNVIFTADGKWDVLASSGVTGVKGNAESSYRQGNVNLTAKNIGAYSLAIHIPNNGDLNDYKTIEQQGFYYGAGGNSIANKPADFDAFSLIVLRAGTGVVTQILVISSATAGVIWRRYWTAGTWRAWQQLPYGVKGARETDYRGGNVNLTPNNIGALDLYPSVPIPANSDLNDYTTIGSYHCANSTTAATLANCPIVIRGFRLIVYKTYGTSSTAESYYTQQIDDYVGNRYIRYKKADLTWSGWRNYASYNFKTIDADTDWNTIVNPGSYKVVNATMNDAHHAPNLYGYGTLTVFWAEENTDTSGYLAYLYIPNLNKTNSKYPLGSMAVRHKNGSNYTDWHIFKDSGLNDDTYVKKTGDKMTGNLTVDGISAFKRSTGQGVYKGDNGVAGWVVIAQIKINASYVNHTLELEVGGRGRSLGTVLGIMFASVSTNDPGLSSFYCYGGDGTDIFRIKKTDTSTWQLIAKKNEAYGSIYVMKVNSQLDFTNEDSITITYPGTHLKDADGNTITTPDSTWIAPTLSGKVAEANQLTTSRNIAIAGAVTGTASFNGTANATITALRRGVMVGNETTSELWFKIASYTSSATFLNEFISFKVNRTIGNDAIEDAGILTAGYRSDVNGVIQYVLLTWETAGINVELSNYIICHNKVAPHIVEIWVKVEKQYRWYNFTVLLEGNRDTIGSGWTLYNRPTGVSAPTAGYTQVVSTLATLQNPAARSDSGELVLNYDFDITVNSSTGIANTAYIQKSSTGTTFYSAFLIIVGGVPLASSDNTYPTRAESRYLPNIIGANVLFQVDVHNLVFDIQVDNGSVMTGSYRILNYTVENTSTTDNKTVRIRVYGIK